MSFLPSMADKTIAFFFFLFICLPHSNCENSSQSWIRGGYWDSHSELPISEINSALFTHLITVKHKNPSVVTLLSIWGAGQDSSIFGSMINQSSSRKTFIKSSIETARLYGFHGLDLAGIKPNRTINMTNLGTLFDEWRDEVNSEARNSGAHAALYGSSSWFNTNYSISEWLRIGVEAQKLVMGLPYHGYAWTLVNPDDNAIGAPASGPRITIDGSVGYKFIKSYIRDYEAIRAKVSYAKEKGLLGYNAFQLSNDDKWELSSAAQKESAEDQRNKPRLLIIILVTVAILMLLLSAIICCLKRRVLKSTGNLSL
ncbi:hypothetical protein Pint_14646 [Pistacia integerrima]|uniref:Uncharacterized protein n=1 Tax=Pistacia integerrima TaxID=434235 RepID=A0ACC0Y784_9ROSI|nr:hypothetical protein Pint_14646 [Pistacia integerrima]